MLHPKNTIAPPSAQESQIIPSSSVESDGNRMPAFSPGQRAIVIDLLKSERRHASRWWTFLNELRLHRQLPEWAEKQDAGRHADWDLWDEDCRSTNRELLGLDIHLNALDHTCETPSLFSANESAPRHGETSDRGAEGGASNE